MMMHDEIGERLHAFRDGELAGSERDAVAAHIDGCPRCRLTLERWERVAIALLRTSAARPSGTFVARVMARIAEEAAQAQAPAWRRWWLTPAFALAAGFLAFFWTGRTVSAPSAELLLLSEGSSWAFGAQEPQSDDVVTVALGEQP